MNKRIRNSILFLLIILSFTVNAQCWKWVGTFEFANFALTKKGYYYSWGDNRYGQLGDGKTVNRNRRTLIDSSNTWSMIAVGQFTTLGLKHDGTIWAWGANYFGQLGNGTKSSSANPRPKQIGTSHDWKFVIGGTNQNYAIKNNGTLWTWGDNTEGELGDSTNLPKYTPIQVGVMTDWKSISTGANHILALKNDGSLWSWGDNGAGELGDGTNIYRNFPRQLGVDKNWKAIDAGYQFSLALKDDGSIWSWGYNGAGQLGDNSALIRNYPVKVINPSGIKWQTMSAGQDHALAIQEDGSLWSWGFNNSGQLGDGTTDSRFSPVQVGTDHDWSSVYAGRAHSIAMKKDGTLWIWGENNFGQLGDSSYTDHYTPVMMACDSNDNYIEPPLPKIYPEGLYIYPNPASDVLNIHPLDAYSIDRVIVIDAVGRKVFERSGHQTTLNIEPLSEGVYFIKIHTAGKYYTRRFIKI